MIQNRNQYHYLIQLILNCIIFIVYSCFNKPRLIEKEEMHPE